MEKQMSKRFLVHRISTIINFSLNAVLICIASALTIVFHYCENDIASLTIWPWVVLHFGLILFLTKVIIISDQGIEMRTLHHKLRQFSWNEILEVQITDIFLNLYVCRTRVEMICCYKDHLTDAEKRICQDSMAFGYSKKALDLIKKYYKGEITAGSIKY